VGMCPSKSPQQLEKQSKNSKTKDGNLIHILQPNYVAQKSTITCSSKKTNIQKNRKTAAESISFTDHRPLLISLRD
jgi:hypothetical protein